MSLTPVVLDSFLGGQNIYSLFNSDFVNFLVKTNRRETENVLFLQFRMFQLSVGGWWWHGTELLV